MDPEENTVQKAQSNKMATVQHRNGGNNVSCHNCHMIDVKERLGVPTLKVSSPSHFFNSPELIN